MKKKKIIRLGGRTGLLSPFVGYVHNLRPIEMLQDILVLVLVSVIQQGPHFSHLQLMIWVDGPTIGFSLWSRKLQIKNYKSNNIRLYFIMKQAPIGYVVSCLSSCGRRRSFCMGIALLFLSSIFDVVYVFTHNMLLVCFRLGVPPWASC